MRLSFLFLFLISIINLSANESKYSYSYIPKEVYVNQVFPVTILAKDAKRVKPIITFDKSSVIKPMNSKPLKDFTGDDVFYTFYFKAEGTNIKLPNFWIAEESGSVVLSGVSIPVKTLEIPENINFCGVIASSFKVKNSKFFLKNSKRRVLGLVIEAHEANLEDFDIPTLKRIKIDKLIRKGSIVSAKYYFKVLTDSTRVNFHYFNTIKQRLISVTVDRKPKVKAVKGKLGLSPKDSGFTRLKKYGVGAISLLFLILFWIYRDYLYLAFFTVTLITLLTFFAPLQRVCVKKGANIYILPIKNSTIGKVVEKEGEFTLFNRYKNRVGNKYYKIEYKDGVIGWIKDEDLCKN